MQYGPLQDIQVCEPTSLALASFALTGASAVAEHKAQNSASVANRDAAIASERDQLNALALRGAQETTAAAEQSHTIDQQGAAAIANARVAAGENGVAGPSVDALIHGVGSQVSAAEGNVRSNLDSTLAQLDADAAGVRSQTQSRINAVPGANPFLTGLKIGGAALDTFGRIRSYKPTTG